MIEEGICPHCNKKMTYEDDENEEVIKFWWECICGRKYDERTGKDITNYECEDVDFSVSDFEIK